MEAVILAGGLGKRLRPIIQNKPKPLALIQNTPFLIVLLKQLEKYSSISKVILSVGYQSKEILAQIKEKTFRFPISFCIEPLPMGTGGAVSLALSGISSSLFFVLNGDTFHNADLDKMVEFHTQKKADITLLCYQQHEQSRYGSIQTNLENQIVSFQEKGINNSQDLLISAGTYIIQKESFIRMQHPFFFSIEHLFEQKVKNFHFFAYPFQGTFIDIGIPNSYHHAQELLKKESIL